MTQREYEILVRELEESAQKDFPNFKTKVRNLALIGYGYIYLVLILAFGFTVLSLFLLSINVLSLLGALPLVLISSGLVYSIYRSVFFAIPTPQGLRIDPSICPHLYEDIELLTQRIQSPPVHEVLFETEFNASVEQTPQLWGLLPTRNYLKLGLPLVFGLSRSEFQAVIAHELGHISKKHNRFGRWIYRINLTWARILANYKEQQRWHHFIFVPFFKWFMPQFSAYAFVLLRKEEFEADKIAAESTNHQITAEALCKVSVLGEFLDKQFYPEMDAQMARNRAPSMSLLTDLLKYLKSWKLEQNAPTYLNKAWMTPTNCRDTHPSLKERVEALGAQQGVALNAENTAANYYFGDQAKTIRENLDRDWVKWIEPLWRVKHQEFKKRDTHLQNFSSREKRGIQLTEAEKWERATLARKLHGPKAALGFLQNYMRDYPKNAKGMFELGKVMLKLDDPLGIRYVEYVQCTNPFFAEQASLLLFEWFSLKGDTEQAAVHHERLLKFHDSLEVIEKERFNLTAHDTFLPHDLDEATVEHILATLQNLSFVESAYLAIKQVTHYTHSPMYIIGLTSSFLNSLSADEEVEVQNFLQEHLNLPNTPFVFHIKGSFTFMKATLREIPGALILERK